MVIIGGKYIWMYDLVLLLTSPSARKFLPGCVGMCRLCLTGSSWEFWLRHVNICSIIRRAVGMTGLFITGANLRWGGKLHLAESFFIKPEVRERYLPKHDRISKIALEFHWGLRELEFVSFLEAENTELGFRDELMFSDCSWCLAFVPCPAVLLSPASLGAELLCNCSWVTLAEEQLLQQWASEPAPSTSPERTLGVPLPFPALTAAQTQLDSSISFFFFPSPALWWFLTVATVL